MADGTEISSLPNVGPLAPTMLAAVSTAPNAGGSSILRWADGSPAAPSVSFDSDPGTGLFLPGAGVLGFAVGGVERARFGWNGNLGIGTGGTPGARLHARSADAELLRIETTAARGGGNLFMSFYDPVGRKGFLGYGASIDDRFVILNEMSDPLMFGTAGDVRWQITANGHFATMGDNNYDIGSGGVRVRNLYLANNPIVTSDGREKTAIRPLTAAELRAGKRIAGIIGIFQFLASVAEKGEDGARLHVGAIAQDVWAIMADEGLIDPTEVDSDPSSRYAFLCWDRWDAEQDGDGEPVRDVGDRFGIRGTQLALFLIAAQEARAAEQEEQIAALTARLDALEAAA